MSHSSLFSLEESSVWDPKVIKKYLVVSQDQLAKLDSIPEWAKVQNNRCTLRLDNEFSIDSSQSEFVVQHSQRIEKNRELFNEQIENRQALLKAHNIYGNKFTRSLSLVNINESCKNLLSNKTLKRASSFLNLYELRSTSIINKHSKDSRSENFFEREIPFDTCNKNILSNKLAENIKLSGEFEISSSVLRKSEELFSNKEINSRTMEIVSQLPATIPNPVENASLHFKTVEVSNDTLPVKNATPALPDQLIKNKITESENADVDHLHSETLDKNNDVVPVSNAATESDQIIKPNMESLNTDLHSEIKEENGGTVSTTVNVVPCINDVSNEPAKAANSATSSFDKFDESCIPVSNENCKPDSNVKEVPHSYNVSAQAEDSSKKYFESQALVSNENYKLDSSSVRVQTNVVSACENPTLSLNVKDKEQIFPSNLCNTEKTISEKCIVSDVISVEKNALKDDVMTLAKSDDFPVEKNALKDDVMTLAKSNDFPVERNALKGDVMTLAKSDDFPVEENSLKDNVMTLAKSDDLDAHDSCFSKSQAVLCPSKAFYVSEKQAVSGTENSITNSSSNIEDKLESKLKECEDKTAEPMKSSADNEASSGDKEVSVSKKRKLESRNKRSKKVKGEDKQGNIKIRSIKKVGEICYNAEEVKTMLDIMKQLL